MVLSKRVVSRRGLRPAGHCSVVRVSLAALRMQRDVQKVPETGNNSPENRHIRYRVFSLTVPDSRY